MKVATIVGTRPDIIKLSRVIAELNDRTEHVLIHTGQNFDLELNEIFFSQLGVKKPDYVLDAAGETAAETIANVIAKADRVLAQEKPDAVLILGDTNSSLSVIPAKRRRIPVFHMEAGNRCFDERVPEEINRRIVDHTSDINLVFSEHARRYLLAEGLRPETVIKTGSPMKEVLDHYRDGIEKSSVLSDLGLEAGRFILVSAHREENVDGRTTLSNLVASLNALATTFDRPVIVSTHPRTRRRLEEHRVADIDPRIRFLKPFGFFDYVNLQKNAFCVVSDSGTVTEESSILGFPAVTIREAHERPEGMDEATLVMSGLHPERVVDSVRLVTAQQPDSARAFRLVPDYDVDNVSRKVVRIIFSYVDYVKRTVWYER